MNDRDQKPSPISSRFAIAVSLLFLGAFHFPISCTGYTDSSAEVDSFCDSLDLIIRVVDDALHKREVAAMRSGELDSLAALRSRWYNLSLNQAWDDTLANYSQLSLDSVSQRRVAALRARLKSDITEHEPQLARMVDSLTRDWITGANRSERYRAAPAWIDSLTPADRTMRRRYYLSTRSGAERYAEWFGRIARMRNQNAKALGYSSAVDVALDSDGLTRDWLANQLALIDSASSATFSQAVDSAIAYYGDAFRGKLETADLHYYMLAPPPTLESNWQILSRDRILSRLKKNLSELGFDLDGLPIEIDMTSLTAPGARPLVISNGTAKPVVVFIGPMRRSCNLDYAHDLAHSLSYAVALTTSHSIQEPVWIEAIAHLLSQLIFTGNDIIALVKATAEQRGSIHRSHDYSVQLEFRRKMAQIEFELELYANPNRDLEAVFRDIYYRWMRVEPQRNAYQFADDFLLLRNGATGHRSLIAQLLSAQLYTHGFRRLGGFASRKDWREFFHEVINATSAGQRWEQALLLVTGERLSATYLATQLTSEARL